MIIHVYSICWNEEKMLPFFFRHYDDIVDQYFIFDNGSTDRSLSILEAHPKVTVGSFETKEHSLVLTALDLFNQFWKNSIGKADWIIVCDVDEHLYHTDLRAYLEDCQAQGITLVTPLGFEMVTDTFPDEASKLCETVQHGVRRHMYDKPQIFNPNAITETNFTPGRHRAAPVGNIISPPTIEIVLLHYKYLGFEYVNSRFSILQQGLQHLDIAHGYGVQYSWGEQQRFQEFSNLLISATKIV